VEKTRTAAASTSPSCRERGGKYLTFKLVDEEYGLKILKVREINGLMDITAVPRMPVYMKGVINLRGKVIPVVDLRLKFGLPEAEPHGADGHYRGGRRPGDRHHRGHGFGVARHFRGQH
jgi:chemotaxis signal transduction protein